jgi:uncharacterized protein YndB with AHSA1/START domain
MDNQFNGIAITRIFGVTAARVWAAWTQPELAKRWWGPQGFYAPSITIDL